MTKTNFIGIAIMVLSGIITAFVAQYSIIAAGLFFMVFAAGLVIAQSTDEDTYEEEMES